MFCEPLDDKILQSAIDFQAASNNAVLVGGSAAAFYAHHRESYDHDHVIQNLPDCYEAILDSLEETGNWEMSDHSSYPYTILGMYNGVQAGFRNLRRETPIESVLVDIPNMGQLRIPTDEEILRVKAYLVVTRNAVRDYLDVTALADYHGRETVKILSTLPEYYVADSGDILERLITRLSECAPRDANTISNLPTYKGIVAPYGSWDYISERCQEIAGELTQA